jgi:hypothetical protein
MGAPRPHRIIRAGVGNDLPQEALEAFVRIVVAAVAY